MSLHWITVALPPVTAVVPLDRVICVQMRPTVLATSDDDQWVVEVVLDDDVALTSDPMTRETASSALGEILMSLQAITLSASQSPSEAS